METDSKILWFIAGAVAAFLLLRHHMKRKPGQGKQGKPRPWKQVSQDKPARTCKGSA
jgi:hypothetical protein